MDKKVFMKKVDVIPMVNQPKTHQISSLEAYRYHLNQKSRPVVPKILAIQKGVYQCRVCLAIQKDGNTFTSINLPEVWKPLKDIFGITVGDNEIWNHFSKICQMCFHQLQDSYKFFCKVKTTERYLKSMMESQKRKREEHNIDDSQMYHNKVPRHPNPSENIQTAYRLEDHTKFEPVPCPSETTENLVEVIYDDNNEDTELDFDFTDDEKDDDEKDDDKKDVKEEIKDDESDVEEIKTEVKIEGTPECKKITNLIMDSGVNGIESQINCCLIDKKTLQQGTQPEEIMLVVDDKPEKGVGLKGVLMNTAITRLNPIKKNSLHETEYIVCDRCKIIYHRPVGSETSKCQICMERDNNS